MPTIGTVESLWRYPVKSMRGEELTEAFMGFSGIFGDRCYAVKNSASRKGFPYLNANVQHQMLAYLPQFRYPEKAIAPPNITESMCIGPGVTPANANADELELDVIMPSGAIISIDDQSLLEVLSEGLHGENNLSVVRSDRALTDCRPVSLISIQTIQQLGTELGIPLDKRRFRANIYLDLTADEGFLEDELVGRRIRIGTKAEIMVLQRDPRCPMISIDPGTGEHNPEVLRHVAQKHANNAGVYCAVLVEGLLNVGDPVCVVD
ncbi:MAG: MOSC domain-containing protein [Chthonomonadales bacterium]